MATGQKKHAGLPAGLGAAPGVETHQPRRTGLYGKPICRQREKPCFAKARSSANQIYVNAAHLCGTSVVQRVICRRLIPCPDRRVLIIIRYFRTLLRGTVAQRTGGLLMQSYGRLRGVRRGLESGRFGRIVHGRLAPRDAEPIAITRWIGCACSAAHLGFATICKTETFGRVF